MTQLADGGDWATRLMLLDISGCKNVCMQGIACLSSSSNSCLPHLTHLDMSSCGLCFDSWPWQHTPPLRVLILAHNTVSIATVHTLAMHCGKTLERLDLHHAIWWPFVSPTTSSVRPPYPCFDKDASSFEALRTLNLAHWGPCTDWRRDGLFDGGSSSGSSSSSSSSGGGGCAGSAFMTNESLCSAAEESLLSMVIMP